MATSRFSSTCGACGGTRRWNGSSSISRTRRWPGLSNARIVHGKGTGAIRQAVRERLRSSNAVDRFAAETDASGGDGATQVWFK